MLIWIPVDGSDAKLSKIMPQYEATQWALIDFDAGEAQSVKFYTTREELGGEWVDFIILKNKFENYMDFMNEGMMCLVRRKEETVEEVISAFAFKELDEIGL